MRVDIAREPVFAEARGFASRAREVPYSVDWAYAVASVTMTFTALSVVSLVVVVSLSVDAVTPVTPHLAPESRRDLEKRLAAIAFPETAGSSVFIALGQALGMKPTKTTYRYEQRYAHLPVIDVDVVPTTEQCADVVLAAKFRPQVKYGPVRIRGRYCLTGLGQWTATYRSITA